MVNKQDVSTVNRILTYIHRFEDGLLSLLLLSMIVLAATQIFIRNLFDSGIVWADPLLRVMVLWLGLMGALAASRENKHITIDVLNRLMTDKVRHLTRIFNALFTAIVTAIIAYHSTLFVLIERESNSVAFSNIPAWMLVVIIPITFAIMSVRNLIHIYQHSIALIESKTKA